MGMKFQGNELECFTTVSGAWDYTTATHPYRANYTRGAMRPMNAVAGHSLYGAFDGSAETTCSLSARFGAGAGWTYETRTFLAFTNSTVPVLGLQSTVSTGYLRLVKWNGSGWDTVATGAALENATAYRFDIYLESYGASADVRVWVKSLGGYEPAVLWISVSSTDVTAPTVSDVDGVYCEPMGETTSARGGIAEVFSAEEPSNRIDLVTIYPNAAGDTNTFDSGDYTDVDERDADTSDYIESGTAAQIFLANCTALPNSTMTPIAVRTVALSAMGTSGPTQLEHDVKTGGTESLGSTEALGLSYAPSWRMMNTNPVTAAAWTNAEITALQIGVKSIA